MKKKILYVLLSITLVMVGAFGTAANGVTAAARDDSLPVTGYKLIIYESSGLSEEDFEVKISIEESDPNRNYSDTKTLYAYLFSGEDILAEYRQVVWWQWDYTYVMAWNRSTIELTGRVGLAQSYFIEEVDGYGYNYGTYVECMSAGKFEIRNVLTNQLIAEWYPVLVAGYGADGSYWII